MFISKKGQVTLFVILGILLLISFFFIARLLTHTQRDIADALEDATPLQDSFVRSIEYCVNAHLDGILDTIFRQGGYLYEDNGGLFLESEISFEKYNSFRIPYGIINATPGYIVPTNLKPSDLPPPFNDIDGLFTENVFGFSTGLFNKEEFLRLPFFGQNTLPMLCDREGKNGINLTGTAFSCHTFLYGSERTIQSQIQRALSQQVRTCFEDSSLLERYQVTTTGSGLVEILLGENDVTVYIDISANYLLNGNKTISQFIFNYPYRVKRLYTMAYLLAERDVTDIFFNKDEDYADIMGCQIAGSPRCWDRHITVEIKRDEFGYNDVVILQDRNTRFENALNSLDPYLTIYFAVQNRRPYLEFIQDMNLVLSPSSTILIDALAMDPDEENITIHSIGPQMIDGYPRESEYFQSEWIPTTSIPRPSLEPYVPYVVDCTSYCVIRDVLPDGSSIYYSTRHFYTAKVQDREGLFDYQNFSITLSE